MNTQTTVSTTAAATIELSKGMFFPDSLMHQILVCLEMRNPTTRFAPDTYAHKAFEFAMVGGAVIDQILGLPVHDYDIHVKEHGWVFACDGEPYDSDEHLVLIQDFLRKEGLTIEVLENNPYAHVNKVVNVMGMPLQFLSMYSDYSNEDVEDFIERKFDIGIKTLSYSLEKGLQWGEAFETSLSTGSLKNALYFYDGWWDLDLEEKEAARLVAATAKYSEHIHRLSVPFAKIKEETIMTNQTTTTTTTTTNRNTFVPWGNCVFAFNASFPLPPYINPYLHPDIQRELLADLDVFVLPEKAGFFRRVVYCGYRNGYAVNITKSYREDGDVCEWDIQYRNLEDVFSLLEGMYYYRSHFGSECEQLGFSILANWLFSDSEQFDNYLERTRDLLPYEEDDFSDLPF